VHDGFSFDVYDVHIFTNNGTVPPGGELIPWTGNPFQGTGSVNPVFTGTRTEGFHVIAADNQGTQVGFDLNGDGTIDDQAADDGNGFLDAQDVFGAVQLTQETTLRALETSTQRSFYLSSRTSGFRVSAEATLTGTVDELNSLSRLNNIQFDYGITEQGNDDGLIFGGAATNGGFRRLGAFNTLGPLSGGAQFIAEFPNAIRLQFDDDLPEQSIRFDYVYGFEGYDLSLGAGDLRYQIEFNFFRN